MLILCALSNAAQASQDNGGGLDYVMNSSNLGIHNTIVPEALTLNGNMALKDQGGAASNTTGYGKLYNNNGDLYYLNGSTAFLLNNMSVLASSVPPDSLDWDDFSDTMTLDATTTVSMGSYDLNFDSNTFVIDSSANRIGIGTSTPTAALQVKGDEVRIGDGAVGTATGNGDLYVADDLEVDGVLYGNGAGLNSIPASAIEAPGSDTYIPYNNSGSFGTDPNLRWDSTAGAGGAIEVQRFRSINMGSPGVPAYSFDNGTNTGMYLVSTSKLAFTVAGSNFVFLTSAGRVGIGDSTPTYALDVAGSIQSSAKVLSDNGNNSTPSFTFTGDTNTGMYSSAANTISFSSGGTKVATIDTTGVNVPAGKIFQSVKSDSPPTCNASTEGGIYYDTSMAQLCFCNGTAWTKVTDATTACT